MCSCRSARTSFGFGLNGVSFKGKNPVVELNKRLTMSSFLRRVASIY
jgi:hypothetical protein